MEYPEFEEYISKHISSDWTAKVNEMKTMLQRGKEVQEQINILGDDGVPLEYHLTFWKSEIIDFVILQQDAFDKIDSVTPLKRQEYMLNLVMDIWRSDFEFNAFTEVMAYFKRIINICKQMNYAAFMSESFLLYQQQLQKIITKKKITQL